MASPRQMRGMTAAGLLFAAFLLCALVTMGALP
jgi:hypothetical protein